MIFVIWLFKKYLFFSQRLILYLSIATLCDSVPYMMGTIDSPFGCKFQVIIRFIGSLLKISGFYYLLTVLIY